MDIVNFTKMEDMTVDETQFLNRKYTDHAQNNLSTQLMNLLRSMKGSKLGYQIDRYRHSLQSATRAFHNGEETEMVVAALLHDVADPIAPENHSAVAAEILKPYVSGRTFWIVRHHGLFQGYYYFHHLGGDRDARERFREHHWFDDCVNFCHEYDQNCFEPNYNEMPLEEFEPLINRVFSQKRSVSISELA